MGYYKTSITCSKNVGVAGMSKSINVSRSHDLNVRDTKHFSFTVNMVKHTWRLKQCYDTECYVSESFSVYQYTKYHKRGFGTKQVNMCPLLKRAFRVTLQIIFVEYEASGKKTFETLTGLDIYQSVLPLVICE